MSSAHLNELQEARAAYRKRYYCAQRCRHAVDDLAQFQLRFDLKAVQAALEENFFFVHHGEVEVDDDTKREMACESASGVLSLAGAHRKVLGGLEVIELKPVFQANWLTSVLGAGYFTGNLRLTDLNGLQPDFKPTEPAGDWVIAAGLVPEELQAVVNLYHDRVQKLTALLLRLKTATRYLRRAADAWSGKPEALTFSELGLLVGPIGTDDEKARFAQLVEQLSELVEEFVGDEGSDAGEWV